MLCLQAVAASLKRHPSIAIIPTLLFLALTTGGIIGVMYVAANETHQRRMSAEGAPCSEQWHVQRTLSSRHVSPASNASCQLLSTLAILATALL